MNKNQLDIRLLPIYFKKIAFGIMLLSIITLITSLILSDSIKIDKDIIQTITKSGLLISLLVFALTRNQTEDELTLKIRLKAFTYSFIFGVVIVITEPFVNLLFRDSFLSEKSVTELLISMLLFYFMVFFLMKKNR